MVNGPRRNRHKYSLNTRHHVVTMHGIRRARTARRVALTLLVKYYHNPIPRLCHTFRCILYYRSIVIASFYLYLSSCLIVSLSIDEWLYVASLPLNFIRFFTTAYYLLLLCHLPSSVPICYFSLLIIFVSVLWLLHYRYFRRFPSPLPSPISSVSIPLSSPPFLLL